MREPRLNQIEYEKKVDKVKLCGQNRGPHNYIPVSWVKTDKEEYVTTLMCLTCLCRISMKTIYEQFEEFKI